MANKRQIIYHDGRPAFMLLPWAEFEALAEKLDEAGLSDEELFDLAHQSGEEYLPAELVHRILDGENPVKAYREHRGLTQKKLAEEVGLNPVYISQIETGNRAGSTRTLGRIAKALGVDLDDLV